MRTLRSSLGTQIDPHTAWMLMRSMETLALRMQRHCENAQALAEFLERHPKVERVIYPGLASHPQHALARRQMRGAGGMIGLLLDGDLGTTRRFLERCRIFTLAESLGGVESLVEHPGIMTHASISAGIRAALGIGDNLVRLSVGVEDIDDLRADLDTALGGGGR